METCNLDDLMRAIGRLEGRVDEGFKATHQRLDTVNGRLNKHDEKIGLLETFRDNLMGRITAMGVVLGSVFGIVGALAKEFFLGK